MILAQEDAKLFFDLMWSLQFYVKNRLSLWPEIQTVAAYSEVETEIRMEVRNAVWENPHLIAEYIRANPDNLNAEQLAIVASWQNFVQGKFFIERTLKKYAVFMQDNTVYGVVGLYDPLAEIVPKQMQPMLVEAVLLPFKDVVIYDGMFSSYHMFFGGGMKRSMKETYNKAKRKGEIIVSFNPTVQQANQAKTKKKMKDWQPVLASLSQEAKSLRAQSGSPPTWSPAFSMVKASLALAETAVAYPEDEEAIWEQFDKLSQLTRRLEEAIYRSA